MTTISTGLCKECGWDKGRHYINCSKISSERRAEVMAQLEKRREELRQSPVYWTLQERKLIREVFNGKNDGLTVAELKEKLGVR